MNSEDESQQTRAQLEQEILQIREALGSTRHLSDSDSESEISGDEDEGESEEDEDRDSGEFIGTCVQLALESLNFIA